MLTLSLLSAIALFLPTRAQEWMGTTGWTKSQRIYEWIVFLFGAAWFSISGVQVALSRMRLWRQLQHLPTDQKEILRFYVQQNVSAHSWVLAHTAPRALEYEGVLEQLPKQPLSKENESKVDGILNYKIKPWVLRYLRKHPKLTED